MNNITFDEYSNPMPGCIRHQEPKCPHVAVIPSVTVSDMSGIKNLADCFVHVTSINTTFYIDDKHRIMTTWAGIATVENYDYTMNPNHFASQVVLDKGTHDVLFFNHEGVIETVLAANQEQVTNIQDRLDHFDGESDSIETYVSGLSNSVENLFTNIAGYDATKTQVLKHVNGVMTWVQE